MMTDRDLSEALELILLRTTQDGMDWTLREDETGVELLGEGIAGYRVKVTEHARSYSIKIGRLEGSTAPPRVVGAVTHNRPNDPAVRSLLEGKTFAIFREAIGRARSDEFRAFSGPASQGLTAIPGVNSGIIHEEEVSLRTPSGDDGEIEF